MKKEDRAKKVRQMLTALGNEQSEGGFNEFSQFCEEGLLAMTEHMTEEGLKRLQERIESASLLGINRRQALDEFSDGPGVW